MKYVMGFLASVVVAGLSAQAQQGCFSAFCNEHSGLSSQITQTYDNLTLVQDMNYRSVRSSIDPNEDYRTCVQGCRTEYDQNRGNCVSVYGGSHLSGLQDCLEVAADRHAACLDPFQKCNETIPPIQ